MSDMNEANEANEKLLLDFIAWADDCGLELCGAVFDPIGGTYIMTSSAVTDLPTLVRTFLSTRGARQ